MRELTIPFTSRETSLCIRLVFFSLLPSTRFDKFSDFCEIFRPHYTPVTRYIFMEKKKERKAIGKDAKKYQNLLINTSRGLRNSTCFRGLSRSCSIEQHNANYFLILYSIYTKSKRLLD